MTTPWYVSLIIALCSGLLSGCVSPFIISWLSKNQKNFDLKYKTLEETLKAISMWEADVYDFSLQNSKEAHDGAVRQVNIRPATHQAIENSKSLIKSWYSENVYSHLDSLLRSNISINNSRFIEHEELKNKFILSATKELKIK